MSSAAQKITASYAGMNGNNFGAAHHNNISAKIRKDLPAFNITQHELTAKVQAVMRDFAGNENAISKLSSALQCSDGTAKNYLEGKTTPQGIYDSRAMAVIPGYLSLKAELAGLEMALDPKHQAKMAEFMRYCQITADQIFGSAQ
jgi:hypothetical protein